MRQAQYYIYRNLHTPKAEGFSVKYKGRVVDSFTEATMHHAKLKVNPGGVAAVRAKRQKVPHAYVVGEMYIKSGIRQPLLPHQEITYNPYLNESFVWKESGLPVFDVDTLVFKRGKIFGIMKKGE